MTEPTPPQKPQTLRAAALMIGSVLITLLLAEAAMRVLDYPLKNKWVASETTLAQFDPLLGWVYIPNSSKTQEFGSDKIPVPMHFDEIGARASSPDRVLDKQKPTIILVGGSYTMGHGVTYEDSFAGQLEVLTDNRFQIINLGVQAYGTDQSLLRLQRHFHEFNTKAVIYTFIYRHVRRNENYDRRIIIPGAQFIGTKPRYTLQGDGSLALNELPVRYEDYSYSRIWALIQRIYADHGPEHDLDLTQALILELKDYVESNGAEFLAVDFRWPHKTPTSLLKNIEGLEFIDAGEGAPEDWIDWRLRGDKHPDRRAHARVASLIMERLETVK